MSLLLLLSGRQITIGGRPPQASGTTSTPQASGTTSVPQASGSTSAPKGSAR